ncbi:MAG: PAS domain S-box protein [Phenylobacterium sp.]|uniref:PAS domain S-box protein n=1 Tax=Phenylobacterium sp. TaxID=1871053 RepID=UPI001A4F2E8E|nr:PAS domain S-box protein [Phenylobacterium sp.]MBL8769850.1 PAS domain S-box protein [Phenylobacterium sp.]
MSSPPRQAAKGSRRANGAPPLIVLNDAAVQSTAGLGFYEWHVAEDRLVWSASLLHIYGLTQTPRGERGFSSLLHPQDRPRIEAQTAAYLGSGADSYSHEFRIVRPDGAIRRILDRGLIERDGQGRVRVIRGVNVDLTGTDPGEQPTGDAAAQHFAELEALYAQAPLGLGLLDTELRFVRLNGALAEMNGFSVAEHLGRRAWDLLPDLRATAEPALRHVLESGAPLRDVPIRGETPARPGQQREWREHFYPVRTPGGDVIGIGVVCEEVSDRMVAERALMESDARFRALSDSSPMMVWVTEADGACTFLSSSWYEFTGQTPEEALGFGWLNAVHPDDASEAERIFMEASARGEAFQLDYRLRRKDGVYRWAIDSAKPRWALDGAFAGFVGSVIDISDRKEAEQRLQASHDTFRRLVESSPFGIYAVDADFRLAQVGKGAQKVFENVRPLIGRDFADVLRLIWQEPFASEAIAHFRRTLETGEPYHSPSTVERRADLDATEAYDWKLERVTMPDGRPGVVCHFYDLSERQAYEEKIQYLMRELNHRAKNMLTLVDAVAKQTAAAGPVDFLSRFSDRIQALAASQDLLVQTEWNGASLSALIRSQLLHFSDLVGQRILLDGPDIDLPPAAAQSLGMALHELATNAAKYGALSNDVGRVAISWRLAQVDGQPWFSMAWIESGGPPVRPPGRRGFGARVAGVMIERALAGKVSLDFAPTGVTWTLGCPAALVSEVQGVRTDGGGRP